MFRRDLHAQRRVFKRLFQPEGLHQCGRADDRRGVLGLVVIGQEQLLAVEVLCRPLAQVRRTAAELVKEVLLARRLVGALDPRDAVPPDREPPESGDEFRRVGT